MTKTFTSTVIGTAVGICLTGLLLYTAGQSTNATVKQLAGKITAGYGAGA